MHFERMDLDGKTVFTPGLTDTWLVFHGKRHRIPSPTVFDALFGNSEHMLAMDDVGQIALGPELSEGACLVRETGTLPIYLVTGLPEGRVMRHFIPTYESLVDFAFDEGRVLALPGLIVNALPLARDLTSAADRTARRI